MQPQLSNIEVDVPEGDVAPARHRGGAKESQCFNRPAADEMAPRRCHQRSSWAVTLRTRGRRPRGVVAPLEEVCFQPEAGSAICVQRFDDSLNSAIRTTYRISLRSSSLLMPRYPSTRVVLFWGSRVAAQEGADDSKRGERRGARNVCRSSVWWLPHTCGGSRAAARVRGERDGTHGADEGTIMILPQVHLRKPCYDFSFL